jgi:hypothetical protein
LRVIFGDLIDTKNITPYLTHEKQEALRVFPSPLLLLIMLNCSQIIFSKALWNFAYVESNRALITKDDRLIKLRPFLLGDDPILQRNIEGILHMCNPFELNLIFIKAWDHLGI